MYDRLNTNQLVKISLQMKLAAPKRCLEGLPVDYETDHCQSGEDRQRTQVLLILIGRRWNWQQG